MRANSRRQLHVTRLTHQAILRQQSENPEIDQVLQDRDQNSPPVAHQAQRRATANLNLLGDHLRGDCELGFNFRVYTVHAPGQLYLANYRVR